MATLLHDFKKFLMQGNLVALAVAVVIGTVFAARREGTDRRHHHADHRVDLRQAQLRGPFVHDQLRAISYTATSSTP